jgi:hypothetical protein
MAPPTGLHWHLAGADGPTGSDVCIAESDHRLGQAKQLVAERLFAARLGDGSMPRPYRSWCDHTHAAAHEATE